MGLVGIPKIILRASAQSFRPMLLSRNTFDACHGYTLQPVRGAGDGGSLVISCAWCGRGWWKNHAHFKPLSSPHTRNRKILQHTAQHHTAPQHITPSAVTPHIVSSGTGMPQHANNLPRFESTPQGRTIKPTCGSRRRTRRY